MPSRTSSADAVAYDDLQPLPPQPTPPRFALSGVLPHAVPAVDVVAVPVLPADGTPGAGNAGDPATPEGPATGLLLGPGAAELGDALGVDLIGVLEAERATGKAGELTSVPVPAGVDGN